MRIRKLRDFEPRSEPVRYGEGDHGKRRLVQAVMMKSGLSVRKATRAVNAVIDAWKGAIRAKDRHIEMPIGHLKVKKTPKNIFKKRYARRAIYGKRKGRLVTWTTYNDPYRVIWRASEEELESLCADLNPEETARAKAEAARIAALDQQITDLLRAVYCVPNAAEREELEQVATGKETFLKCLEAMARNGSRYNFWDPDGFRLTVATRTRQIRQACSSRGIVL